MEGRHAAKPGRTQKIPNKLPYWQLLVRSIFVLGERIERNLYNLLETLIRAKYTKNRQQLLEQANLTLEILRFQMRLAKDPQCLKVNSYGFTAKAMDEIGVREQHNRREIRGF
jgi:hypothetical protein